MPRIKYDFNPFALTGISPENLKDKDAVMKKLGKLVTKTIKEKAANQKSAVSKRGKWARLSKEYAKDKKKGNRTANLKLTSEMLGSLDTKKLAGRNVLRTAVSEDENEKADGHCNFSGNSKLPERRFIPNVEDGETWQKALIKEMGKIIKENKKDGSD